MLEDIASRFLYYPEPIPPDMPPPQWAADSREVWIDTEDGVRIHGLWWPAPEGRPTILFLHGNAQEVYSWSLVREDLAALECGMLLIDYRGYGKSEGKPGESGLYADGRGALEWLRREGIEAGETVIFGKSLGGAVACEIARGVNLKGLILESTFTSLASVACNLFPFARGYTPADTAYNSLAKLPEIQCGLMVIHGDADMLIPVGEGEALFEAAGEPKCPAPQVRLSTESVEAPLRQGARPRRTSVVRRGSGTQPEWMQRRSNASVFVERGTNRLLIVRGAGHNDVSIVAGSEYGGRIREWLDGL
ncbi:MAG: alpha/beta hydrolase [Actinobacteria bacterium]|nr:alpha/beta hydrolase [Actinomycetota bacterium]MCG2817490.1 alpha/beta hydrolase [Actinomycetes bacterium]MBU4217974.1 alpha/beta hydrolase [Actinomycetota bacterium]MBU4357912.1 alpha/beta hydrolase [Actinomycetota bacterium]MBU4393037.1 alpha/beta hydrolase [Actinomycetota bacterium]